MADLFDKEASTISRLLSCDEVGKAVGYSRVHIYR